MINYESTYEQYKLVIKSVVYEYYAHFLWPILLLQLILRYFPQFSLMNVRNYRPNWVAFPCGWTWNFQFLFGYVSFFQIKASAHVTDNIIFYASS